MASALKYNPSHLRHLDIGGNNLQDSDVKLLRELVESPHFRLEKLRSVQLLIRHVMACDLGCALARLSCFVHRSKIFSLLSERSKESRKYSHL